MTSKRMAINKPKSKQTAEPIMIIDDDDDEDDDASMQVIDLDLEYPISDPLASPSGASTAIDQIEEGGKSKTKTKIAAHEERESGNETEEDEKELENTEEEEEQEEQEEEREEEQEEEERGEEEEEEEEQQENQSNVQQTTKINNTRQQLRERVAAQKTKSLPEDEEFEENIDSCSDVIELDSDDDDNDSRNDTACAKSSNDLIRKQGNYYTCWKCKKNFINIMTARRHVEIEHSSKAAATTKYAQTAKTNEPIEYEGRYRIKYITKPPGSAFALTNDCIKATQRVGDKYACKYCGRKYAIPSSLYAHIKARHLDYKYECIECDKSFSSKVRLNVHTQSYHSMIIKYLNKHKRQRALKPRQSFSNADAYSLNKQRTLKPRPSFPSADAYSTVDEEQQQQPDEATIINAANDSSNSQDSYQGSVADEAWNSRTSSPPPLLDVECNLGPEEEQTPAPNDSNNLTPECTICRITFVSEKNLKTHMYKLHSIHDDGASGSKCSSIDQLSPCDNQKILKNIKRVKSCQLFRSLIKKINDQHFICLKCKQHFKARRIIARHIRTKHMKENNENESVSAAASPQSQPSKAAEESEDYENSQSYYNSSFDSHSQTLNNDDDNLLQLYPHLMEDEDMPESQEDFHHHTDPDLEPALLFESNLIEGEHEKDDYNSSGKLSYKQNCRIVGKHFYCRLCTNPRAYNHYNNLCEHIRAKHYAVRYDCKFCHKSFSGKRTLRLHCEAKHFQPKKVYKPHQALYYQEQQQHVLMNLHQRNLQQQYNKKPQQQQSYPAAAEIEKQHKPKAAQTTSSKTARIIPNARCRIKYVETPETKAIKKACQMNALLRNGYHICRKCPDNSQKYKHKTDLFTHIKTKHYGVTYDCTECFKKYTQRSSLRRHTRLRHGLKLQFVSSTEIAQLKEKRDLYTKQVGSYYYCKLCTCKKFISSTGVDYHIRMKHLGEISAKYKTSHFDAALHNRPPADDAAVSSRLQNIPPSPLIAAEQKRKLYESLIRKIKTNFVCLKCTSLKFASLPLAKRHVQSVHLAAAAHLVQNKNLSSPVNQYPKLKPHLSINNQTTSATNAFPVDLNPAYPVNSLEIVSVAENTFQHQTIIPTHCDTFEITVLDDSAAAAAANDFMPSEMPPPPLSTKDTMVKKEIDYDNELLTLNPMSSDNCSSFQDSYSDCATTYMAGETSSGYDTGSTFNHPTNQTDYDNWDRPNENAEFDAELLQPIDYDKDYRIKNESISSKNDYTVDLACTDLMEAVGDKYYCLKCPKSKGFLRKRDCFRHIREKHMELGKHQCPECGKTYTLEEGLKKHIRLMHAVVLKYKSAYSRPSEMVKRIGKFFRCALCNHSRKYSSKSGIAYHIKLNHFGKRHSCAECGKSFVDAGKLSTHLKHKNHSMSSKKFGNMISKLTDQTEVSDEHSELWEESSVEDSAQHSAEDVYLPSQAANPPPFTIAAVYSANDQQHMEHLHDWPGWTANESMPDPTNQKSDNYQHDEPYVVNGIEPICDIKTEMEQEDQSDLF